MEQIDTFKNPERHLPQEKLFFVGFHLSFWGFQCLIMFDFYRIFRNGEDDTCPTEMLIVNTIQYILFFSLAQLESN